MCGASIGNFKFSVKRDEMRFNLFFSCIKTVLRKHNVNSMPNKPVISGSFFSDYFFYFLQQHHITKEKNLQVVLCETKEKRQINSKTAFKVGFEQR